MSVSHELRTPLTVMRLAGDNLASGKMIAPEQVKRYGETIRTQAERLGNMVEQVLTFARSERPDWQARTDSVRPEAILEAALASAESVLRESRCEVQSQTRTAASSRVATAIERLEHTSHIRRWNSRPAVCHFEHDVRAVRENTYSDPAPAGAITRRIHE